MSLPLFSAPAGGTTVPVATAGGRVTPGTGRSAGPYAIWSNTHVIATPPPVLQSLNRWSELIRVFLFHSTTETTTETRTGRDHIRTHTISARPAATGGEHPAAPLAMARMSFWLADVPLLLLLRRSEHSSMPLKKRVHSDAHY